MDAHAVERAVALLDEVGARQAATAVAERWLEDALDQLGGLDLVPTRRAEIESLAHAFVHRTS
jgi:geranylgeranyl pyrophosphate synthase